VLKYLYINFHCRFFSGCIITTTNSSRSINGDQVTGDPAEVSKGPGRKGRGSAKDARTRVKERVAKERGESGGGVWGRAVTGVTFLWPSLLFLFFLFFYFFCFFKINFEKKVKAFKMLRKKEKG
jgi:hypothetical protein